MNSDSKPLCILDSSPLDSNSKNLLDSGFRILLHRAKRTSSIFLVNRCDHNERLQGRKKHIRTDVPWFTYEINKKGPV